MATGKSILSSLRAELDLSDYRKLHWEGTFEDYLNIVLERADVTRTAYQRLYDMIISHGVDEVYENKDRITRYKFFTEFAARHGDSVYGIDRSLNQLVHTFKSAAQGYGTERRSCSCTVRSAPPRAPLRDSSSAAWKNIRGWTRACSSPIRGECRTATIRKCPMHEEPLHLVPLELRPAFLRDMNANRKPGTYEVTIRGDMCPFCRSMFNERMAKYNGDWHRVVEEVKVFRLLLSEQDRVGIGTFQPKDEKNQDSTELTGDINYRKIAEYGSDSDPRAFNFDGELNIANRGLVEFIEVLKLDVAFLYDLLGASQEHKIKPKKFAQTDIDEVILGHTNEPEYKRLQNNEFMEALRDRTVKIDIPYVTRLREEIKIYEKGFQRQRG